METTTRRSVPALIRELLDRPREFSFVQAVRLLGSIGEREESGLTHANPENGLRFRPKLSLDFPPTDLDTVELKLETGKLVESECLTLGLLDKADIKNSSKTQPAWTKYFMHGLGHSLGIDVHDLGNRYNKLEANHVFTCEPGIYVREEGIGVRIENDILISNDAPIDLMADIPIEVEEIEDLMNR